MVTALIESASAVNGEGRQDHGAAGLVLGRMLPHRNGQLSSGGLGEFRMCQRQQIQRMPLLCSDFGAGDEPCPRWCRGGGCRGVKVSGSGEGSVCRFGLAERGPAPHGDGVDVAGGDLRYRMPSAGGGCRGQSVKVRASSAPSTVTRSRFIFPLPHRRFGRTRTTSTTFHNPSGTRPTTTAMHRISHRQEPRARLMRELRPVTLREQRFRRGRYRRRGSP